MTTSPPPRGASKAMPTARRSCARARPTRSWVRKCSSSARTCSASAPSSSAAPSTRCRSSTSGGGGLLSGSALATRALAPQCKLYGVEPEAGNDGQQSFRSGSIVHIDTPKTIADGAQTQHLGQHTFPIIRRDVEDVLTASDAQLV